jgi:hypothetical protein
MQELLENRGCDEVVQLLGRLKQQGIDRAPVVDGDGKAAGFLALDDLLGSTCPRSTH